MPLSHTQIGVSVRRDRSARRTDHADSLGLCESQTAGRHPKVMSIDEIMPALPVVASVLLVLVLYVIHRWTR